MLLITNVIVKQYKYVKTIVNLSKKKIKMKLFVASTIAAIGVNGQETISCNIGETDTPLFEIECDAEAADMIVTINEDCRSQDFRIDSIFH